MRLYGGQVPVIAEDILRELTRSDDLDISEANRPEVELDIQSVLKEYIRLDRELHDRARDIIAKDGGSLGRVKAELARKKNVQIGEESIEYIVNQLIETFLHSNHVDEVYATDRDIRKKVAPILKRHMSVDEELDREVRDRIKNIEEGSQAWDIEYKKVMEKMKESKNLE